MLTDEIDVDDGALTLEPPAEGATFENPPNGGKRAWLIVFSCAVIQALLSIMELLIRQSILDEDLSSATGVDSETLIEIYLQYIALSNLYAPLGAIVMIYLGYRATICIGAGVVMVTVIILSYLKDDTEHAIKFFLYVPAAIGTSFIKLSVLIPVLEYFTTKRMKALFLSRLGIYGGRIIFILVSLLGSTNWRKNLRGCTGLCIGIGLVGLTLKELKLTLKDATGTFVEKTLGLGRKEIFKNLLLWSTCVVYFFYQWGIETPQGLFIDSEILKQLGIDKNASQLLLYIFSPIFGQILGMFSAWIFKKVAYEEESRLHVKTLKGDRLNIVFGILALSAFLMAIGCFIAPKAVNFSYFFTFSLLFGAFFAFCEGLRDDAVPEEFNRENIRIVEGLILMFAGFGGVITNEIAGEIEGDDEDDWKKLFNYGGGMLLVSTVVTFFVLLVKQSQTSRSKFVGNSVVPNRENENPRNSNPRQTVVINLTSQQQSRVSNTRFRGFQKSNQQNVQTANQPSRFQQYHQSSVTMPNQPGSDQQYQQPFATMSNQPGGVHQFQQPSLPMINQPGSAQHYQQLSVPMPNHPSNVQQYQQPILLMPNQVGGVQQYQQPPVPMPNQHGSVQQFQTDISMANQSGGFRPYQIRHDLQQNVQFGGPQ